MEPTGTGTPTAAHGGVLSQSLWEKPSTNRGCCLPWELCHWGLWAPPWARCIPPLVFTPGHAQLLPFTGIQGCKWEFCKGGSCKCGCGAVHTSPSWVPHPCAQDHQSPPKTPGSVPWHKALPLIQILLGLPDSGVWGNEDGSFAISLCPINPECDPPRLDWGRELGIASPAHCTRVRVTWQC